MLFGEAYEHIKEYTTFFNSPPPPPKLGHRVTPVGLFEHMLIHAIQATYQIQIPVHETWFFVSGELHWGRGVILNPGDPFRIVIPMRRKNRFQTLPSKNVTLKKNQ